MKCTLTIVESKNPRIPPLIILNNELWEGDKVEPALLFYLQSQSPRAALWIHAHCNLIWYKPFQLSKAQLPPSPTPLFNRWNLHEMGFSTAPLSTYLSNLLEAGLTYPWIDDFTIEEGVQYYNQRMERFRNKLGLDFHSISYIHF